MDFNNRAYQDEEHKLLHYHKSDDQWVFKGEVQNIHLSSLRDEKCCIIAVHPPLCNIFNSSPDGGNHRNRVSFKKIPAIVGEIVHQVFLLLRQPKESDTFDPNVLITHHFAYDYCSSHLHPGRKLGVLAAKQVLLYLQI